MKVYTFTILLLLSSSLLLAQPNPRIAQIRKTVQKINADTAYTIMTLENEQFLEKMTDGGGQLMGYFKNGQLVKVLEKVGLSSCVGNYEYYYQNNELIYVRGKEHIFVYIDSTNSFDYTSEKLGCTFSYYIQNDREIYSMYAGHSRCMQSSKVITFSELLKGGKKYAVLLKQ